MSAELILQAICKSPILMGDCPEAESFDRTNLTLPAGDKSLSLDQKLGHIYEDAFELVLRASDRYELLEKSLQLQDGIHKTLGELDFLFRDHESGKLIHLELAVKFYLAVETPKVLLLPGPDARDNYFKKLDRLRIHQLTLAQRYHQHLPSAYRKEGITSQHLILGCLFDHVSAASPALPDFLSLNARRGKWLRQSEFSRHFPKNPRAEIIPKRLWPVATELLRDLEIFDQTTALERCLLLKIEGESMPVFLVPDHYPDHR